ncbi:hypothetical protein [Limosilactobacillus oris]|uniref:hypothetical protein n=1 Tax=Limosilactobacillus oris TaxID=1632 RepID=UPI00054D806D|nr:hypothetical protein [Limosilactobacillus oris]
MSKQRQKHQATVARDYYYCISRKFAHGWRKLARMSRARRRDIYMVPQGQHISVLIRKEVSVLRQH